ncbi:MAG: M20/M25/M40 family metallo-hydrolase [Actinomycetota bacterium]|jgi:acetylornithine deacetylase/succinyl-diaminopimelate desuccinylase-like protein|nr:M20/M25/M40 family metallo-hydrolase [Actinomycetota bacterium]
MPRDAADPAWLEELSEFLRIPSVSADPGHAEDVQRAAEWVRDFVRGAGGGAEVVPTATLPLCIGEIPASNGNVDAPTVLIYGHFDVQPAAPLEAWHSPPFEPEVRDGWLYARGAADDKGNLYLLLKAAETLAREGRLPVNVRVACDGEEETGGHQIVDYLAADERGADACVIFDGPMPKTDVPAFEVGTRGLIYFHVRARTGQRDLHSGLYGGAALNAVHALTQALASVVAEPEELKEGIVPPTEEELAAWRELEPGADVLADQGARPRDARAADEFYLRTFAGISVDVNGIYGGEPVLQKTVLPVEAQANVSIRLAPGQDVDTIAASFERLVREAAPEGAEIEIERWSSSPAGLVAPGSDAVRLAQDAFERALGRRPLLLRSGGTLPIVPALGDKGIPTILSGFDVPEGNIHSPNERLLVRYLPLGVSAARETLLAFADLP